MKINEFTPDSKIFESNSVGNVINKENNDSNVFFTILKDKLNEVNNKQISAEKFTSDFIKGEDVDVHEVMINSEEAKMSMELAVQVRNKIVEAYQELNRMQL
ncbi:flagellar hook-basal body complex protein FliE [Clostridium rectalis]|uniref:flagellar hook-basal body complex protein FliE n=1 Tax=Clostridium rectalis TaxID=2040295 RepID=UPI000F632631|nr:flagellar hook-basal body complex protein FliE [Clostridium rectalis]